MTWQPIATAPKDGTPIMLLSPDGDVGLGYIEYGRYGKEPRGHAAWIGINRWGAAGTNVFIGGHSPLAATHWMPLPEPPVE